MGASALAKGVARSFVGNPAQLSRLLLVFLPPLLLFLVGYPLVRSISWNDPTSKFFDRWRAYGYRSYSDVRQTEARQFIQKYNATDNELTFHRNAEAAAKEGDDAAAAAAPFLCVGLSTVVRPSGDIYVRDALGSLLDGLSQSERDQLWLMPLIGHTNATEHPVYSEPWLRRVSDRVMTFDDGSLDEGRRARVEEIELERKRTGVPDREKTIIDYVHVMRQCEATGAKYILMLEDDVLFLDGWFHRTKAALRSVEQRAAPKDDNDPGWFYLRLFYVTRAEQHNWTREDRITYFASAGLITVLLLVVPRLLRAWLPPWAQALRAKARQNWPVVLVGGGLTFVAFTWLFFAAGRFTSVGEWRGVREFHGCCTQGVVYPRRKVAPLTAWYEEKRLGFVDSLSDELADKRPHGVDIGSRWALGPVVLQHVGTNSSKGDNWGSDKPGELSASQTLWNFMFELNSASKLAAEHRAAIESSEGGHGRWSWAYGY